MDVLNAVLTTGIISILLGVCGYFINMWIGSVNESIKDTQNKLDELKEQVTSVETSVGIVRTIQENQFKNAVELSASTQSKLNQTMDAIAAVKKDVSNQQHTLENYGKVIRKYFILDKNGKQ